MGLREQLAQFFYPRICASCEALCNEPLSFCAVCARTLKRIVGPICSRCGLPLAGTPGPSLICGSCLAYPPAYDRARAAFVYAQNDSASALARALARFKYGRLTTLAAALGELLRYSCPVDPFAYDWIIPVPLAPQRLRWRGFNQSVLLARAIASRHQILPDALQRVRDTPPQAQLGRRERVHNLRGAFCVAPRSNAAVMGRRVLLVDDVVTTGATAHECALNIRRAGAEKVDVLALARVTLL